MNLIKKKLKFINANKNSLVLICKCSKMFYRIVKYGLKNFFKNNDEALDCYVQINFFYSIFKTQIHIKTFQFYLNPLQFFFLKSLIQKILIWLKILTEN